MFDFYRTLISLIDEGRRVAVATIIEARGSTPQEQGGKMIVTDDGKSFFSVGGGALEAMVLEEARTCLEAGRPALKSYSLHEVGDDALGMACGGKAMVYIEVIMPPHDLVVFGAGHVGRALARLAAPLGFGITVVDDRPGMLQAEAFPPGTRLITTDRNYSENLPRITPASYVVLVTRCHDTDEAALRSLIHVPTAYLGMIGSKRKVKVVFERMAGEGIDRALFENVRAPIGLPIGSHLPDEVALSIMAEIVAFKNGVAGEPRAGS